MSLEKATLTNSITAEEVPVLFNPEECVLSRQNNFAQVAVFGLKAPLLQFVNGALRTFTMELLVDALEEHKQGNRVLNRAGDDVRKLTSKITGLLDIDRTTHAPPLVIFSWGSITFTAVVTQADQTFVMFREDGAPLRARMAISLSEFTNTEMEPKEIKRETSDYTKLVTVRASETLPAIAAREYGNAALWPAIGAANGIEDPRELALGLTLRLPKLPYVDPSTGRVYS